MKIKTLPIGQVKAGPEDGLADGQFLVYPSTFTRKRDAYGEVVAKGAFLEDIARWEESGNTLPGLYGHRMDDPDYFVAAALEQGEDEHGWWVKGEFDLDSPKGPQVYRLVKGRRITQLSFAYDVLESGRSEDENGDAVEELRKLRVYEFSFVPVGANQDTSVVAVKALAEDLAAKAGRVLSAKNESALREARDSIDSVLSSLSDGDEEKSAHPGGSDQDAASGTTTEVKSGASDEAEGKSPVSDEDQGCTPSVKGLAAIFDIYAAAYAVEEGV